MVPSTVLSKRRVKKNGAWTPKVLVQWQSLPKEEATWVSAEELHKAYPSFDLEGKVTFDGRGINTNFRIEGTVDQQGHVTNDPSTQVT